MEMYGRRVITTDAVALTSENIVSEINKAFDTQFADLKNHSSFARYTRTNSQGKYTMVLSFTDLNKSENAEYVKGLGIYKDFKADITLSEFEAFLVKTGFVKVTD